MKVEMMRQKKKATLRWGESSWILQISHRCPIQSLTKKKQLEAKSSSKELRDPDPALAKRKIENHMCVRRRRRRRRMARCEVRAWCGAQRDAARLCPFLSIFFSVCPKPRSWTFFSISIQHQIQCSHSTTWDPVLGKTQPQELVYVDRNGDHP